MIYELFVTRLPAPAFSAKDVLDLYLHRGSFETVLADEDIEQDPDRWCSHTPCGQEFWQILSQWVWNLRLELGQRFSPAAMRTTEFAPACEPEPAPSAPESSPVPASEPAPVLVESRAEPEEQVVGQAPLDLSRFDSEPPRARPAGSVRVRSLLNTE